VAADCTAQILQFGHGSRHRTDDRNAIQADTCALIAGQSRSLSVIGMLARRFLPNTGCWLS
jgi:hypothetical protein